MKISPKTRRNISRIIPYAIIWWLIGWVIIITELGVTRNQNVNPDTDISFTIPVLIFANVANLIVGAIVGALEVIYFEKRFTRLSLRSKIFYKFCVYISLFLIVVILFYPIAFTIESGISLLEPDGWRKEARFLKSITFLTTIFQLSISLISCLIYSAVSENLGHNLFLNLVTGKYHKPVVEERVFMFLDMKSSTIIAESIGHIKYFRLLEEYYNIMSDPIIHSHGEVYQYIGDEIVVSWPLKKGVENSNCVHCFFNIKKELKKKRNDFMKQYGYEIEFKAGMHLGEVAIGEIGALKKEIVFTGDVLNTTARIQSLCNQLESDLLICIDLMERLPENYYSYESKDLLELRGKASKMEIFKVS